LVFAVWRRPWALFRDCSPRQIAVLVAFGAVLGVMNTVFYLAIDRLPLGTVGAIEFVGPVLLAAAGTRTQRNLGALIIAVLGVYLLTNVRFAGEPLGFLLAFANCALFMLYVVLGHRLAADGGANGIDRLAAAMLIAFVVVSPMGLRDALPAFSDVKLLGAAIVVGVCSSIIPYVCDQLAMARLSRATFALLLSLLPAAATLIGAVVLRQIPSMLEIVGIALVVAGVAAHRAGET
jgi:inner membrane transporter RhtA